MPRVLSLTSLRLSLLAAAGVTVAACASSPQQTGSGGAATSTAATGGKAGTGGAGGASTGSTGGAAGGGAASGGAGGMAPVDPVCAGAVPIPSANGSYSGFATCPDDTVHRVAPATCDATIDAPACTGAEQTITCQSDADCTAAPHGRCTHTDTVEDAGLVTACGCHYSCIDDADCTTGQVCICAGVLPVLNEWSFCAPAACVTGADCASGECAASIYFNGCFSDVEVVCRAPSDACRVDADCAGDGGAHRSCAFSKGAWQCLGWTCVLGRALVIDGQGRTAPAVRRADWSAAVAPPLGGLSAEARAARAAYWEAAAAMEHASVASFARFTLSLLALGAPAALVAEAQRAGRDEVEHARLAYGLASAYAGRAVGPGPLHLGAAPVLTERSAVLRALIEEACVGETLGVAEALALAAAEEDPALRALHRRIAADEQRHAELAWRTLAWLCDGEAQRALARGWFAAAMAAAGRDPGPGLLSAATLGAVRRQAIREVVAPCAAALLGGAAAEWAASPAV